MQPHPKIQSTEYADLNRVIGWFITIRWIACLFVLATLLLAHRVFRYFLPFALLYGVLGLLCLSNLVFNLFFAVLRQGNLSRREMILLFHSQICCDYIFLFLLVYLSGFLENPFTYFFVFHIMLTSFIFDADVVIRYVTGLIVLLLLALFAEANGIIPHFPLKSGLPPVHVSAYAEAYRAGYRELLLPRAIGLCSTLTISAYLITNIKNRIEEKGKRVEVELDRYKELDKIKSNFILQVTHELRGPLAAVSGYHEMVLRGITGEIAARTEETLKKAERRTGNLLTIIDEMIDYAYMKSEEDSRYRKSELNLKEVIQHNFTTLAHQAKEKSIRLLSSCPGSLKTYANRDLINIILNNLVNNAIKYSPEGTTVRVNADLAGDEIHLQVKDEGYGIEPEEMDKVFEEFYRTRKARELERDGTGLGLPIVKRAVESLGGRITAYSEVNRGTTFHVFIPYEGTGTVSIGGEHETENTDH